MSKSLGNVVNPVHVQEGIELEALIQNLAEAHLDPKEMDVASEGMRRGFPQGIPQCGSDAMRLALCSFAGAGRTAPMNVNVLVSYRNFCNKMWNAVKFALPNLSTGGFDIASLGPSDRWILSRLSHALEIAKKGFEGFVMGDAVQAMNHFFHDELCSVYLESTKPVFQGSDAERKATTSAVLYECIESALRMLHPFMPYVTEDLWQRLPKRFDVPSIMLAPYPLPNAEWAAFDCRLMELAMLCAAAARTIKTTYSIKQNYIPVHIASDIPDIAESFSLIRALALVGEVTAIPYGSSPELGYSSQIVNEQIEVRLNLSGIIDFAKELAASQTKKEKLVVLFEKLKKKIEGKDYAERVPAAIQETEKEKMEAYGTQIAALDDVIASLNASLSAQQ
jgi:valyl-tRNA synthetase